MIGKDSSENKNMNTNVKIFLKVRKNPIVQNCTEINFLGALGKLSRIFSQRVMQFALRFLCDCCYVGLDALKRVRVFALCQNTGILDKKCTKCKKTLFKE